VTKERGAYPLEERTKAQPVSAKSRLFFGNFGANSFHWSKWASEGLGSYEENPLKYFYEFLRFTLRCSSIRRNSEPICKI